MSKPVAVVTGGATGIGAAVVEQLAEDCLVAVLDVNEAEGSRVAEHAGGRFYSCDVRDFAAVEAVAARVASELGVPRYVHLNAGVMTVAPSEPYAPIEDVTLDQYQRIVGINLTGVFHGLKVFLPMLRPAGGAITVTASIAGFSKLAIDPLYATTKYAVIGLTRAVATANADSGVRINAICPGVVATDIVPDAMREADIPSMPPAELAAEVVDLLKQGHNCEVRVKLPGVPGFPMDTPDLAAAAAAGGGAG